MKIPPPWESSAGHPRTPCWPRSWKFRRLKNRTVNPLKFLGDPTDVILNVYRRHPKLKCSLFMESIRIAHLKISIWFVVKRKFFPQKKDVQVNEVKFHHSKPILQLGEHVCARLRMNIPVTKKGETVMPKQNQNILPPPKKKTNIKTAKN